jgi:hypothetical protein
MAAADEFVFAADGMVIVVSFPATSYARSESIARLD